MMASLMRRSAVKVKLLLAIWLLSLAARIASLALGQSNPPIQTASDRTPSYDVVSVKPAKPDEGTSMWWRRNADGFSARATLQSLVMSAYGLIMEDQLSGLPKWATTEQFDFEAKMDADRAQAHEKLSSEERKKQDDAMLQ